MRTSKIKLQISKEVPYNAEFVAMIKKGDKQIAEGKGIKMSIADFKSIIDVKNL